MDFLTLSWSKLHKDTYELAQKIKEEKIDLIVAIARGGLSIAHILSDFIDVTITSFTISSYSNLQQGKDIKLLFKINGNIKNKRVLLVDDVSDTGKTFIRGTKYLKELGVKKIITAAIFIKPWTKHKPDHYIEETSSWIIFPYEIRETITALYKKFKNEGLTKKAVRVKLKNIGVEEYFINKYL